MTEERRRKPREVVEVEKAVGTDRKMGEGRGREMRKWLREEPPDKTSALLSLLLLVVSSIRLRTFALSCIPNSFDLF